MIRIIFIIAMLYCDAATFCRRRNDAGIMTDETGRRCAQESIDIIIMKNTYYYLFIINNFDHLLIGINLHRAKVIFLCETDNNSLFLFF